MTFQDLALINATQLVLLQFCFGDADSGSVQTTENLVEGVLPVFGVFGRGRWLRVPLDEAADSVEVAGETRAEHLLLLGVISDGFYL